MELRDTRPGAIIGLTARGSRHDRAAETRGALDGAPCEWILTAGSAVAVAERGDGVLALARAADDPRPSAGPSVLLGRTGGGAAMVRSAELDPEADAAPAGTVLRDLREILAALDREDAQLALAAVGMAAWHRATRFCPRCGSPLRHESDGWVLRCDADGSQHFPRTDTAVIMAVRDPDDRLLLAQNVRARGRFHSVLAGFVEPGETFEDAVARETREEVGIDVERVEYAGSQPWPFPASLMVGFRAWSAHRGELLLQDDEIAEARWCTRAELASALTSEEMRLPGPGSIGRALIEDWYGERLPE